MMSLEEQIARDYFHYSNHSDMVNIAGLCQDSCTYHSAQLGFFVGVAEVISMQQTFHRQYASLAWTIESLTVIKPQVVAIHFSFDGVLLNGQTQHREGVEHIVIYAGKIQHITVA